jgi:hypothetical protein
MKTSHHSKRSMRTPDYSSKGLRTYGHSYRSIRTPEYPAGEREPSLQMQEYERARIQLCTFNSNYRSMISPDYSFRSTRPYDYSYRNIRTLAYPAGI